jgi:hypothetical protein
VNQTRSGLIWIVALVVGIFWSGYHHFHSQSSKWSSPVYINLTTEHSFDKSLRGTLKIARKKTGIDYAVIMMPELPAGESIEHYAYSAFQQNKIGESTGGKGLLMLIVQQPAQMKIEVSKTLEGVFPDIVCSELEQASKSFILNKDVRNYVAEFVITSGLYYLKNPNSLSKSNLKVAKNGLALSIGADEGKLSRLSAGGGVLSRNYYHLLQEIYGEVRREPSATLQNLEPAEDPKISAQRYIDSLGAGVSSAKIPFLTKGSQFFRMEYPKTPDFLKRNFRYYQDAGSFQLYTSGRLAAALFPQGNPVWPILLVKNKAGKWLIDEAKSWAYFSQFEDSNDFMIKYPEHPYSFAWEEAHHPLRNAILYGNRSHASPLIADSEKLLSDIEEAQVALHKNPKNAQKYFELADLFYFEMHWLGEAKTLVKEGLKLDPKNLAYNWRLLDLNIITDDVDAALTSMKTIMKISPSDEILKLWYKQTKELYD